MSERTRNVIVGFTMLIALGLSIYGIIFLGKFPLFRGVHYYHVALLAPNANGVASGARVELNGVYAGQVESVYLTTGADGKLVVRAELQINPSIDIPTSASATINRPATGVGNTMVEISATTAQGNLPKDGSAVITASASGNGLIPENVISDVHVLREDLSNLAQKIGTTTDQLTTVATDLHVLLAYTPPEAVDGVNPNTPNTPKANISTAIVRLDRFIASMQKLLGDPELPGKVRQAVDNIAEASASLKGTFAKLDVAAGNANTAIGAIANAANSLNTAAGKASAVMDTTQKDVDKIADQLTQTLNSMDKLLKAISEGNGTTGLLIKDPRLYQSLLDLSDTLKTTVHDLDFNLNKWKDEGINLHLK